MRPTDWTPLAEADPVPGDVDRVRSAGTHYASVADAIRTAAAKLRTIVDDPSMQSQAVAATRDRASDVADDIVRAQVRYEAAGRALTVYAGALGDAKAESAAILARAKAAMESRAAATTILDLGPTSGLPSPECLRAQCTVEEADAAIARARAQLRAVEDARDASAQSARHAIDDAKHQTGDLNDGWWTNWGAKVVKTIAKACDWIAAGAAVLSLAAMFVPVIGVPLAGVLQSVALGAALVSAAANLTVAVAGDGSSSKGKLWKEFGWSALSVATFGVGRVALTGLRVSIQGAHGAARLAAGRFAAQSPAARGALGLPTVNNSAKAIEEMLATPNPMTRATAQDLVRASDNQGLLPSPGEVVANVRGIRGEVANDLQDIRHANWTAVRSGAGSHVDDLRHEFEAGQADTLAMRLFGEGKPAGDIARLHQLPDALRGSEIVTSHLTRVQIHVGAFGAASAAEVGLELRAVAPQ